MTMPPKTLRFLLRGLALLPGVLLMLALGVGALHHHAHGDGSHACAICSLSHAPATTTAAFVCGAPVVHYERVVATRFSAPGASCPASASSRSPPSS